MKKVRFEENIYEPEYKRSCTECIQFSASKCAQCRKFKCERHMSESQCNTCDLSKNVFSYLNLR